MRVQHKAEALFKDNNILCPFEHEMALFYSHNLLQLSLLINFSICVGLMAKLLFNKLLNNNYLCFVVISFLFLLVMVQ